MIKNKLENIGIPSPVKEDIGKLVDFYSKNGIENIMEEYIYLSSDNKTNPDEVGLIIANILLVPGKEKQKFIYLQRFNNFGDLSDIHIVSLPHGYHRDILKEYNSNVLRIPEIFFDSDIIHYIVSGGYIDFSDKPHRVYSSSGDFGGKISKYKTTDITAFLLNEAFGNMFSSENIREGKEYIENMINFMEEHKLNKDFYERLIDFYYNQGSMLKQHFLAIMTMKCLDRVINEDGDLLSALVEETTKGIGRYILLKGVEYNLKKQQNNVSF